MMETLSGYFLWLKTLHLISVMAWMAGLLYLPRLFVYHCDAKPGSELSETLKVMERRLIRAIMNPAMIASWIFGVSMLFAGSEGQSLELWMIIKLVCALAMTGTHMKLAGWRKEFEVDKNQYSHRFYRIINEVPTVLLIIIIAMAVMKPA